MTAAQTTDGSVQAREGKQRQNQGRRNGGGDSEEQYKTC